MAISDYTLLHGKFVIRYPDLPRSGPQPDGDTVKFLPDTPALVDDLDQISGVRARINARGISVRLEAIDALETHFNSRHQELKGANEARFQLLDTLGFRNVKYFAKKPNNVESASADSLRGSVLSNGIDANGRLIGFIYKEVDGKRFGANGDTVEVGITTIDNSINATLLADGHVYPAFYGTLSPPLRKHLATKSRDAREAGKGLWPRAKADLNGPADDVDADALQKLVIWPKLFRRLVPYFSSGNSNLSDFADWLQADPVNRDDEVSLLDANGDETDPPTTARLHELVEVTAGGSGIQLTRWPEDFIIKPDPA